MAHQVIINESYGGFELSDLAVLEVMDYLFTHGYPEASDFDVRHGRLPRHHPAYIFAFNRLGSEKMSATLSYLKIYSLNGHMYKIKEYDGAESVMEPDDIKWIDTRDL